MDGQRKQIGKAFNLLIILACIATLILLHKYAHEKWSTIYINLPNRTKEFNDKGMQGVFKLKTTEDIVIQRDTITNHTMVQRIQRNSKVVAVNQTQTVVQKRINKGDVFVKNMTTDSPIKEVTTKSDPVVNRTSLEWTTRQSSQKHDQVVTKVTLVNTVQEATPNSDQNAVEVTKTPIQKVHVTQKPNRTLANVTSLDPGFINSKHFVNPSQKTTPIETRMNSGNPKHTSTPVNKNLAAPHPIIDDIKPPPWHKPVDLRIISLVFNRASSLKRQLDSLNAAEYFGDKVLLEVWIDRSKKNGNIDSETYLVAKNFTFKYGEVRIHNHTRHVGLYGQWFGTWDPDPDSNEIAVFLEDDVSVSPFFYRWLRNVHKKYDKRKDVAGYSLSGICPRFKNRWGNVRGPKTEICMLYRASGSWGVSPNRENWFRFIEWYKNTSRDPTFEPLVEGILPSRWYQRYMKAGTTDEMWTMWHIYYTYVNNQFTVFSNFPNEIGLTCHWQEEGLHYSKSGTLKTSAPLLTKWDKKYDNLPDKLVKLDYDGKIIE